MSIVVPVARRASPDARNTITFATSWVTAGDGFDVAEILKSIWAIPEVEDVTIVTGSLDMVVRIRVRDHAHLRALLLDHVWQIPGMQRTETHIAMAEMPAKDFASELLERMCAGTAGPTSGVPARKP